MKAAAGSGRLHKYKIWNLETGQEVFTFAGDTFAVEAVAVTPDGKAVISGSWDGSIKVWDLISKEVIFNLKGHTSFVQSVAVSPDSKRLISGSGDNSIKVWNLETGKELFTLTGHTDWGQIRSIYSRWTKYCFRQL